MIFISTILAHPLTSTSLHGDRKEMSLQCCMITINTSQPRFLPDLELSHAAFINKDIQLSTLCKVLHDNLLCLPDSSHDSHNALQ